MADVVNGWYDSRIAPNQWSDSTMACRSLTGVVAQRNDPKEVSLRERFAV